MAYELIPADAARTPLAMAQFQQSGNEVLGYVAWVGAVIGVLALIIIGGRMIHANFTGDPWIAARGMAELPWVVLGVVLLIASGSLAGMLLQGSHHETENDLGSLIAGVAAEQNEIEQDAAGCEGALRDPDSQEFLCPDDDGWERLSHTVPLTGPDDERCTYDGKEDCYEYCFVSGFHEGNTYTRSPCTPGQDDMDLLNGDNWIWARYHCANLPSSLWNQSDSCPDNPVDHFDDVPSEYARAGRGEPAMHKYYICTEFPEWAEGNKREDQVGDDYCNVG
ncbi:TrbC/VirB2 family protein [Nocardiopsis sp. NPDC058631]|uniref:TrbC/VirB2 family protein n=1 Tax=Nocardiopsis sp. NPDC058631 TaxID=3346566 RepID=UPI00365D383A